MSRTRLTVLIIAMLLIGLSVPKGIQLYQRYQNNHPSVLPEKNQDSLTSPGSEMAERAKKLPYRLDTTISPNPEQEVR